MKRRGETTVVSPHLLEYYLIGTLISDEDGYFIILIWLYLRIQKEYVKFLAMLSISTLI